MPDPQPAPIPLPATDEELLAQCRVETFRASGKGGQHVNKTESAVRMTHLPSGTVAVCQRERSQFLNKEICLRRLREKIEERNRTPEERLATRVPRSAKRRSRIAKTRQSIKKRGRARPSSDDDE